MGRRRALSVLAIFSAMASLGAQAPALTVLRAGPTGGIAERAEANEIRIVF
jgi:hypothetical protein